MKKTTTHVVGALLLALVSGGSMHAQYQLPNAGFEAWEEQTIEDVPATGSTTKSNTATEPMNWNSFGTAKAADALTAMAINNKQLEKSQDEKKNGSYSALIKSQSIFGIIANGNLTTGRINAGSVIATNAANHNITIPGDPNFSVPFTGRPDSLKVWVKYVPANETAVKGENKARISAILHDNTAVVDPNGESAHIVGAAKANYAPSKQGEAYDWQLLTIPFDYSTDLYAGSSMLPSYILVTFATNQNPGEGSGGDLVYIDEVAMVYNAKLTALQYNGVAVANFNKDKQAYTIDGEYTEGCLTATTGGQGATVTVSYNEASSTATVRVEGDNISEVPTNYSEYTVEFEEENTVNPSITGRYDGKLSVIINGAAVPPTDESVTIEMDGTQTYATFSLHNFMLEDMGVGNIDITEIPVTVDTDTFRLAVSKDIYITEGDDPNVIWLGPAVSADGVPIVLKATVSFDGMLNVQIDIPLIPGTMDVVVSFTNETPDALDEVGMSTAGFSLYRVNDGTIGISGVEIGTEYQVFSQSGVLVMNGRLQGADLNLENFPRGMYLIKIGDQVEKFIR